jgi:hypothetical protein
LRVFTSAQAFGGRQMLSLRLTHLLFTAFARHRPSKCSGVFRNWENILVGAVANRLLGCYMNGHHPNRIDFGFRARAASREPFGAD